MGRTTEWHYRQALAKAGLLLGDPTDLPAIEVLKAATTRAAARSIAQQEISTVEPWRAHIEPMVKRGARPRAIRDCLRLSYPEFLCSESAVKRFVARLAREAGVAPDDVVIPVETGPGEVAQVDFGYVGKIYDPSAGVPDLLILDEARKPLVIALGGGVFLGARGPPCGAGWQVARIRRPSPREPGSTKSVRTAILVMGMQV
jgi:hypothetical protein